MAPASPEGARRPPADWQKALRDLRLEPTRSALVVLAIALGIAAFSTVLSSYAILVRELNRGYLETHPASAILHTDTVDAPLIREALQGHGVREAEARRVVRGRVKAASGEWRSLVLFVVEDYGDIRISRLVPQAGVWPPAAGEMLVERDALQVARARIGDAVRVRIGDGAERTLRLSGTAHDVGQAQARMENLVYGYVTLETLATLGEQPYLDQLLIVVDGDASSEAHVRGVSEELGRWLEGRGHPVRRIEVPKPGKHPHADIMGLLLLAKAGFGLFALLLSGFLVANLLTALLAAQVRQIGVMKAIGGTRARIGRIYLAQALLLGVLATLVAVPVGIWGSHVLCRSMAVFLNFDIESFAGPAWVYLLVAAVGILTPLLAAAWPVARGTRISVREALSDHGTARAGFGTSAFDRQLAKLGGVKRPLLLAIRNAGRRRARLWQTVATLATAGVFFLSALNVRASLVRTIDRLFESMRYDLTVSLGSLQSWETVDRAMRRTPGVVRAEGWVGSEATLAADAASEPATAASHAASRSLGHGAGPKSADRFTLVALPADSAFVAPDIVEGRRLERGDTNALLVNQVLAARSPQLQPDREVSLRIGHRTFPFRVVGITREPFSPAVGYIPLAHFEELTSHRGMASSVRLVLERNDAASLAAAKQAVDESLEREGLRAHSSVSAADRRVGFDQHLLMIYVFLTVMSAILALVGGLGLATTMSLNVLERRREMGVLRAIGAPPRTIWLILVCEAVAIGLLSFAIAAIVAWPFGRLVANGMVASLFRVTPDFAFEPLGLVVWLLVSIVLGSAASLLPAWHASRVSVREAISYE
jgi:putative ABC transport system permease protein